MHYILSITAALAMLFCTVVFSGCDSSMPPQDAATTDSSANDHGHDHTAQSDLHDDADHGHHNHAAPHGGQVVELGHDHRLHAEIVDDHDNESIAIYMLDGDLKPLQIDATTISLILIVGDNAETFEAAAQESSNVEEAFFVIDDASAFELIETAGVQGKLRVTIEGQPYSGTFDGHDHDH